MVVVRDAAPRLDTASAASVAPVPPWRIATVPVTFAASPEVLLVSVPGMSAATRERKVGVAEDDPVLGPARTVFAPSEFMVTASVPDVVTGLPDTLKMLGMVKPTLVTAPAAAQFALPSTSMPMANSPLH